MPRYLILLLAIVVTGCASSDRFTAEVARFHRLSDEPIGNRTVAVEPADITDGGLEFATYANMIGEEFRRYGYRPPEAGAPSDLVALVDYEVRERGTVDRGSPASVGVGVGGGGRNVGVGLGGVFGVGGNRTDTYYLRELRVQLKERDGDRSLWEARASSEGTENEAPLVLPYLIDAVFAQFPGPNGQTTTYEAKRDD